MIRRGESSILLNQNREYDSSKDAVVDDGKVRMIVARISDMEKNPRYLGSLEEIRITRTLLDLLMQRGFESREAIARINQDHLAKLGFASEELL